jgi:hypothetical protein
MGSRAGSVPRASKAQRSRSKRPRTTKPRTTKPRARSGSARRPRWRVLVARALAVSAAVVALGAFAYWAYRVTLTPVHDRGQATGNTHPGHTLRFYLDRPSVKEALIQIGGNLVLLAPLGILLPVVFARLRSAVLITCCAALISLMIETAQGVLIAGRAFDADDVILNTAGVLLTYLLFGRRVARLVRGDR